jgi:hypothetical protein
MAKKKRVTKTATQKALAARTKTLSEKKNVLSGATVYLSGPMDFVASRKEEKEFGWRNRISQFVRNFGVTVYDPWYKPDVKGMRHYGKEDEFTTNKRQNWTFEDSRKGDQTRAELCNEFWPTLHIDLRMTDTADFLIAFVPTNIYSVGTVHEIVMARLQHKPVLFVSPSVTFPVYDELEAHLKDKRDKKGQQLLAELAQQAPLRPNPGGVPSMWYMALVDAHYFFDGFGFAQYRRKFGWKEGALDVHEKEFPPKRPLLPYLEQVNRALPKRYDLEQDRYVENPEWLIFEDEDL